MKRMTSGSRLMRANASRSPERNCRNNSRSVSSSATRLLGAVAEGRAHQAERRRAEPEQLLVKPRVRIAAAPTGLRLRAQSDDLELAPRIAAVGRVKSGARRLAGRRGTLEVAVVLEAVHGFVHRHAAGVQPDGDGESGDADQGFERDTDDETGVVGAKTFLDAELLGV